MAKIEIKESKKTKETTFNSLTPDILEENKQVYTDALDYAFDSDAILNIAITGIYGAGKSSVWNTYIDSKARTKIYKRIIDLYRKTGFTRLFFKKLFSNLLNPFNSVITICLGKYGDDFEGYTESHNTKNNEIDEHIERQIINQILLQTKSNKIPLSKYKFKGNVPIIKLLINILCSLMFIGAGIFWSFREETIFNLKKIFEGFDDSYLFISCCLMFFIPIGLFLFKFYKENKVKFSKMNFQGTEAKFSDENDDETVLERNIKEIVYLLDSSNSRIVVFEDLDRYENIDIFVKLKELNFLLNAYLKTNRKGKKVRFVYLVKESLFSSKDRTKFFDFILPIVPLVDANTSEHYLRELFAKDKNLKQIVSEKTMRNISLYIDDMRILRNIFNEFKVYLSVISMEDLRLNGDQLFALITIKNIYPNEFELLQQDKGYIVEVFDKVRASIDKIVNNLKNRLDANATDAQKLLREVAIGKYEKMSSYITKDVALSSNNSNNSSTNFEWVPFLQYWDENPKKEYDIISNTFKGKCNYDQFLTKFIYTSDKIKNKLIMENKENQRLIQELAKEKRNLLKKVGDIKTFQVKELIMEMKADDINNIFEGQYDEARPVRYPLIRYLIIEGLVDETYGYYKRAFDVKKSNTLKQNDTIFMKRLLEKEKSDIFLNLESPNEIMNRLELTDFSRFNILNRYLLEECVKNEEKDKVSTILNTVSKNDLYEDLIKIIDDLPLEITNYIVDLLIDEKSYKIKKILNNCSDKNNVALRNITYSILMNKNVSEEELIHYRDYIEQSAGLIEIVEKDNFSEFIQNAQEKNVQFNNLENIKVVEAGVLKETIENDNEDDIITDTDRAFLQQRLEMIMNFNLYKFNMSNIKFLAENILNKKISYGDLLSEVFVATELEKIKKNIEDCFESFLLDYFYTSDYNEAFSVGEDLFLKILNSKLPNEVLKDFIRIINSQIGDLREINRKNDTLEIVDELFINDKVKFSATNLNYHWELIHENDEKNPNLAKESLSKFIKKLNLKITERIVANYKKNRLRKNEILSQCLPMCNELINANSVSDYLFEFLIENSNIPITSLNADLKDDRIKVLVKKNKILPNEENIKILMAKSLNEEIRLMAENHENEVLPILKKYGTV